MRTIDIHAHITPAGFVEAFRKGENWHGVTASVVPNMRYNPRTTWSPDERIADMNSLGVDVQVLSTNAFFYCYDEDASTVTAMARRLQRLRGPTYQRPSRPLFPVSPPCRCRTLPPPSPSWSAV